MKIVIDGREIRISKSALDLKKTAFIKEVGNALKDYGFDSEKLKEKLNEVYDLTHKGE